MSRRASRVALALAAALLAPAAWAGAFIFAEEGDEDSITHPAGYTGTGGARTLGVCLRTATLPAGVSATQVENTVLKAVATWNAQRVASANLGLGTANDLTNASSFDFESVLLHEMGHCLGLAHPNHATESGLADPARNGTKSTDGANNAFNQGAGSDGLHGSADDVRGDDGNLYWYRNASNDPLAFPAIIDSTTFRLAGGLPAGHSYARNGDRSVLAAMGVANTESVMQQGQLNDEAQRRLTGEDVATIRLGQAGLDELQGTADDYTFQLAYLGRQNDCDITVEFNSDSAFAYCSVGGSTIGGSDHVRVTEANLVFSPTTTWFFSPAFNTTTTIGGDTPDPSQPGASYTVSATVAVTTAAPAGPATGTVEIADDLGNTCSATLAAGAASCALTGVAGTRTLRATYLGFRGFDASTSAPVTHQVTTSNATLSLSDTPSSSVVGQPYTVNANVSGSAGTPTGSVTVDDGAGASCTITLAGGNGSCQLASTVAGTRTLSGTYSGNATYGSDTDSETHAVNAAQTTTTIVTRTPSSSVVGQPVTVQVAVAVDAPGIGTPGGSVTIGDGVASCVATLSNGSGSCAFAPTTVGNRSVTASYGASPNFAASSDSETQAVAKATTTLAITADTPDASAPGQDVTVNLALQVAAPGAGTPTGSIVVSAAGTGESCTATLPATSCTIDLVGTGVRTLSASYAGDARFLASSDTESHTVAGADARIVLTLTPEPSVVGTPLTASFVVTAVAPAVGTPTGTVAVETGRAGESCNAVLPATSCVLVLSDAGVRSVTARYSGDSFYDGDEDSVLQDVDALDVGRILRDGFEGG